MHRSAIACAIAALSCFAAPALAAPPEPGVPLPEGTDIEPNDVFSDRIVINGSDDCKWSAFIDGRLGDYNALQPDTDLCVITFEFCDNTNDDGGPFSRWGGSALFFIQPSLGQPGNWFPITVRVAGKGFYTQNLNTHSETGPVEVYIRFYDNAGSFISQQVRRGTLNGTSDQLIWSVPVPGNTFDFDVIVNPLASERGDVDFYEVDGLRPNVEYDLRIVSGLHDRNLGPGGLPLPLDTILGEFSASGALVDFNDDICNGGGCGAWNPRSALRVRADAQGRVRFAVTGYDDFNFNGIRDSGGFNANVAHDQTGQYTLRINHVCRLGCVDNNGDCIVNFVDLNNVLNSFGETCP